MASSTVENYLKRIYLEQQRDPRRPVPMGQLASAMGVVPGTATTMIKALADSGLVHYTPRGGARLTRGGEQLAMHVLRRHRLVELFLVQIVGLDWSEVHAEAEELEHAISDKVLQRIDALLNHPKVDPHGDPIPTPKGTVTQPPLQSLADCPLKTSLRVARIMDQTPAFLQFAHKCGLKPGVHVTVASREPSADSVELKVHPRGKITLGLPAAAKFMVEYT